MQKLIFTLLVAVSVATCYAQDSTYIEMDYIGNQDKPVKSIFIYPKHIMPDAIAEDTSGYAAFTETFAVTAQLYAAINNLIDSYSLNHSMNDTSGYPAFSYNIYIHSTDDSHVFLKTIVPTNDEAQVFFGQLLALFDKYQPSEKLRDYLDWRVFYTFK